VSHTLIIDPEGAVRFIYSDELVGVLEGQTVTRRASHVEPCGDRWIADLHPVRGPRLGPFDTRGEALDAEVAWLIANHIPLPDQGG